MPSSGTELSERLASLLSLVPVIGIVRLNSHNFAEQAVQAIIDGGMLAAEVTLTTPGALNLVRRKRNSFGEEVLLGTGSIRTEADARAAIEAGSSFLVTPTFNPAVIALSVEYGVPIICGGYTPTELDTAHQAGAQYVKLFPASRLGPSYLREIRAPMPDLQVVPTGGVTLENIDDWLRAGATAVAIGSALVSQNSADRGAWEAMTVAASQFVTTAVRARTGGS